MPRPTPPPDLFTPPTPTTPSRRKTKKATATPKTEEPEVISHAQIDLKKPGGGNGNGNGVWTSEKKGIFLEEVIAAGYRAVDLVSLAEKVSIVSGLSVCFSRDVDVGG
jgi:hypothetical protein